MLSRRRAEAIDIAKGVHHSIALLSFGEHEVHLTGRSRRLLGQRHPVAAEPGDGDERQIGACVALRRFSLQGIPAGGTVHNVPVTLRYQGGAGQKPFVGDEHAQPARRFGAVLLDDDREHAFGGRGRD